MCLGPDFVDWQFVATGVGGGDVKLHYLNSTVNLFKKTVT